jgi:hypothetical protein
VNLSIDITKLKVIEFGVGRDNDEDGTAFSTVPVDREVKAALVEMAVDTWSRMTHISTDPAQYEASEKYESTDYVYLPLKDDLASSLRHLHESANVPTDTGALADPWNVFCYFARFVDPKGRQMTGVRRAAQFKGILGKRLIRILDDTLKLVEDKRLQVGSRF